MEYLIIEGGSARALTEYVNEKIKEGWVPQGGVSITASECEEFRYEDYAQAMVKVDDKPCCGKH